MLPKQIVTSALFHEINLIAITDHNASQNAAAVIEVAEAEGLLALPGMELETMEEIHALCLFENLSQLQALQDVVDRNLPNRPNNEEILGPQTIVDTDGQVLANETRMLLAPVQISIQTACQIVSDLGGLFIPAHVNREAFGLLPRMGSIPPDLPVEFLELTRNADPAILIKKYPQLSDYHLIKNGDVHYLDEFLGSAVFSAADSSLAAIRTGLLSIS
jgi:PHP family Zn ribbon phosphoesterase